jgi:type I restriction enzyme, S subunit
LPKNKVLIFGKIKSMVVFDFRYSDVEGLTRLDAEYYNPIYINKVKLVRNINSKKVNELFKIELGPAFSSKKIGVDNGIPISKIGDVTNKRKVSSWDFLDEIEFSKYGNRNIRQNEILMTLTGDPPDVGKVNMPFTEFDDKETVLAFNQRVAKLETKDIDPFYLFAALSSEYFRVRFEQCAFGIRQRNVSIPDLKSAYIYVADDNHIEEISNLVREHFRLKNESERYYKQATTLLESELGLDKITFDNPKSYTASFSEVVNSNRADADFYQVKFKQLEEYISTLKTTALASICSFQKGYEVGTKLYTDDGPTFIRVSNLTIKGFTFGNSDKYILNNTYNILKVHKPNIGDILLTKDGTIGTCYLVDEEVEGIVSSGIMNLTLNDTSIPKEYLALVINSQICQMQADRDCSGALITHWKPEQIRKMKIPILSSETMEHLADLVTRSKAARRKSKQLLEQAKIHVEELIEEASK